MKRAVMLLAVGALILGSTLSAQAQAPTVSFGGQMRLYGFAYNNITDFKNSDDGQFRDSASYYFQRFRLFTTVESADKKARIHWALEIGDITWGDNGGAGGNNYGCNGSLGGVSGIAGVGGATRTGPGSGGCFGADGVNVETKHIYMWADTSGLVPGTSVSLGIQGVQFMTSPIGAFMDDDAAAIVVNWKLDPMDLQFYTAKLAENNVSNADDVDMYVGRFGMNVTKDIRVTLEGMLVNQQSLAGSSLGDNFWIGATASGKIDVLNLHASAVYGQRSFARAAGVPAGDPFDASGFGAFVSAQVPIGPLSVFGIFWYTTGDSAQGPGNCPTSNGVSTANCGLPNITLTQDSDKLPLPDSGASWFGGGGPFIAEWLFGMSTIGAPGLRTGGANGALQYADPTGTWGFGASASYALTPTLSVGGGAALVLATDAGGPYGDSLVEIDAGLTYRFNSNLTLNLFAGYLIPDSGDSGWATAFRTQYSF